MMVARPLIGKMTDKIGACWVALPSIVFTILGTLPFVFFDNGTAAWIIWAVLAIRGIGVGGFTIPAMSDSYVGLKKPQIPQTSIATRIIQNVGAAFGSALLVTVVSNFLQDVPGYAPKGFASAEATLTLPDFEQRFVCLRFYPLNHISSSMQATKCRTSHS